MITKLEIFEDSIAEGPVRAGQAHFTFRNNQLSTTFTYDGAYLAETQNAYQLDPALPMVAGPLHVNGLPGAFRDSLPDRWGRNLILRSRKAAAQGNQGAQRQLNDVDFLCGVYDLPREGALRFRKPECDEFLSPGSLIPPVIQLPELLQASREVAAETAGLDKIKELLEAGSGSLGGARPKASVVDQGKLLLAKFSHPHDQWDVIGKEKKTLDLAKELGIEVPGSHLVKIGKDEVLLLERFDRQESRLHGARIPYMSAMTALGAEDGEVRDYIELAEVVAAITKKVPSQLEELFKRVAFYVAVHNTDDHLRNWGFLRVGGDWRLAPMFDVNPNPCKNEPRATLIAGRSLEGEREGLFELAEYCGLDQATRDSILREIDSAVASAAL